MLGLKLNHVSKRGPRWRFYALTRPSLLQIMVHCLIGASRYIDQYCVLLLLPANLETFVEINERQFYLRKRTLQNAGPFVLVSMKTLIGLTVMAITRKHSAPSYYSCFDSELWSDELRIPENTKHLLLNMYRHYGYNDKCVFYYRRD